MAVAMRSKASVCGRLFAGIAGSNPAVGIDVCLLASVVCCQVEVCASGWSLVQRSRTDYCVSRFDREASVRRRPFRIRGGCAMGGGGGAYRHRFVFLIIICLFPEQG